MHGCSASLQIERNMKVQKGLITITAWKLIDFGETHMLETLL